MTLLAYVLGKDGIGEVVFGTSNQPVPQPFGCIVVASAVEQRLVGNEEGVGVAGGDRQHR